MDEVYRTVEPESIDSDHLTMTESVSEPIDAEFNGGIEYVASNIVSPDKQPPDTPWQKSASATLLFARFTWLVSVVLILLLLKLLVPQIAEQYFYASTRGKLRAEYELSSAVLEGEPLKQLSLASQMVSRRVAPSVVHIQTIHSEPMDAEEQDHGRFHPWGRESQGQGSGFIVDDEGYILTNWHVIRGTRQLQEEIQRHQQSMERRLSSQEMVRFLNAHQEIKVSLSDERAVNATIVGFDRPTDVALLKVSADELIPIDWGDSDKLEVGSLVWAVGSPFGLQQSVTSGILSAKHRSTGTVYQDFLQTDAAVNPGNSGGPLVDDRGRVVGINTAIVGETYQGISFAIPSAVARDVYRRIRDDGRVARGWLGVQMSDVSPELVDELGLTDDNGAYIERVVDEPGVPSPAKDAGLEEGDVIVKWNETIIDQSTTLSRAVAATDIGETVSVEIIRRGKTMTKAVVVGERPAELN